MNRVLFLIVATSTLCLAQPRLASVAILPGPVKGTSIGSYIDQKTPASITAFASGSVFQSLDSGVTWTEAKIPGLQEGQGLYLANDTKGNLYYFYATKVDKGTEGFFSKSTDGGKKWSDAQSFGVAPGTASSFTLGSHPKKDGLTLVWTQIEQTAGQECMSHVYVSTTASGGKKWSEPRRLNKEPGNCDSVGGRLIPTAPVLSKDGKTFVIWAGKESIHLDRSFDGGEMWINSDVHVTDQVGGWQPVIPGSANGGAAFSAAIDNSVYRSAGTIYLVYTDQKFGPTDTDVWLLRSPNHGDNWTYPLRLNKDESGTHQYSPKVAVDQATGYVYVVYFDRRENKENATDIYLAYSSDGGAAFEETKITDAPFTPDEQIPELVSVAAYKGVINVLWTTTEGGKTTIRSATVRQDRL